MKRILSLTLCLLLTLVMLAGCVQEGPQQSDKITLNVYNWGQYISDGSDDCLDVIAAFEEAYPHIDVNYSTFDSNEVMYTKLAGGGITVDVIIPSDYMIARMIEEDMLLPLNFGNIPNYQYIDDNFKNTVYDPENKYSVPYAWGTVGIVYNTKYVDEADLTGWELLWNEKYEDKILMYDNSRDAFGIAQLMLGYSLNTTDEQELRDCAELLAKQKPYVQQYVMDQIFDLMQNEEAWIAPCYAGDYVTMADENEDLAFYRPASGFNLFIDAMCIPKCAQEKEAAELFINFLCEPEIAAGNMEWICYSTPLKREAVEEFLGAEVLDDPVAYPDDEEIARGTSFDSLPAKISRLMESLFLNARIR
jgi:spermidine/putrescine transport system substrate-binding protein